MQRYFLNESYNESVHEYEVTGEPFHHMIRVMRMEAGNHVYLVFANDMSLEAEIHQVKADAVVLKPVAIEQLQRELPIKVTIASGFPKGDKLEWIVQKGTELGAAQFLAYPAKTSIVKWDPKKRQKKQERLQKIAQEAAEQSHRQVCPTVELFATQADLLAAMKTADCVLVAYEESAKKGEHAQLVKTFRKVAPGEHLMILFGPEGGFLPEEIERFVAAGAICCGLGPRILRTETAPLYVLGAASYHYELLHDTNDTD